jgi:hypothetical protein
VRFHTAPHHHPQGLPTPRSRCAMAHRLDRHNATVGAVLRAMRDGEALHPSFDHRAGPSWWLTRGAKVPSEIARVAVENRLVVPVGDALFGCLAQTLRWTDDLGGKNER